MKHLPVVTLFSALMSGLLAGCQMPGIKLTEDTPEQNLPSKLVTKTDETVSHGSSASSTQVQVRNLIGQDTERLKVQADGGDILAARVLGLRYLLGRKEKPSPIKGVHYLKLAGLKGDRVALNSLILYYTGKIKPADSIDKKRIAWNNVCAVTAPFDRNKLNRMLNGRTKLVVAQCHLTGTGVKKNLGLGLNLIAVAAKSDHNTAAATFMERVNRKGYYGLKVNPERAQYWAQTKTNNIQWQKDIQWCQQAQRRDATLSDIKRERCNTVLRRS